MIFQNCLKFQILKFQDSACQILKFYDSAFKNLKFRDSAFPPPPPPPPPNLIVRSNWGQAPSYLRVWMTGPLGYLMVWIRHWYGWVRGWNFILWSFTWKLLSRTFLWYCFFMLYKVVLTFEFVNEILKCDHSNESYWAELSCGTVFLCCTRWF